MLRRRSLEQQRDEARAQADKLDALIERQAVAAISQEIVAERARQLEEECRQADTYDNMRTECAERVASAQTNLWRLTDQQENARKMLDGHLARNATDEAATVGLHLGALSLTADRARQQLQAVQDEWASIPSSSIDADDRRAAVELRGISKSASRSAKYMQAEAKRSFDGEIRTLGALSAQRPGLLRQIPSSMIDNRGVAR